MTDTDPEADDLADDPNRRFLKGSMWAGRRGRRSTLAGASLTDPNPPTPQPQDPDEPDAPTPPHDMNDWLRAKAAGGPTQRAAAQRMGLVEPEQPEEDPDGD